MSNENKIVVSIQNKLKKYSSDSIKRGLKISNILLQDYVKKWHCLCTIQGYSREINLNNSNKTITVWGDNTAIAITSDGKLCAKVDAWGKIEVWNLTMDKHLYSINFSYQPENNFQKNHYMQDFCATHTKLGRIYNLFITNNNQNLVAISGGEMKIWNIVTGQLKKYIPKIYQFAINPNNNTIAICQYSESSIAKIYDLENGSTLLTINFSPNDDEEEIDIEHISLSNNGRYIAISGNKGMNFDDEKCEYLAQQHEIKLWNIKENNLLQNYVEYLDLEFQDKDSPYIASPLLQFSPDEKFLISTDDQIKVIKVRNTCTEETLYNMANILIKKQFIISNNNKFIGCSKNNNAIAVIELSTGKELALLFGHSDEIISMSVSANSQFLVSSSRDKTVKIWNLDSGNLIQSIDNLPCPVKSILMTDNENRFLTTDIEGTVKIWQLS